MLLILMLPLMMGTRRGEQSGCGTSQDARQLIFETNAGRQTVVPSRNRTQDIPINPSAVTIQYRGDESSVLYAWSERGSGETLIGRRYFAISQYLGQRSDHSAERFTFEARSVDLPNGISIVRQYDQGNCSVFQSWGVFQERLKNALERFAQDRGAQHFTNSTLMPLILLDASVASGRIYSGDTGDTFRFTRGYNINVGPFGYFMLVRFEGGFRTSAGTVRFVPTTITVRNPDTNTNAQTEALELALNSEFISQLNMIMDDTLFQRLPPPPRFLPLSCDPSSPGEPASCINLLNRILAREVGVSLLPAQVRCQRRPGDVGPGGFCEFRPNVLRTQEYPEGFEFVLSDVIDDQGQRIIAVDNGGGDRVCHEGPGAPVPVDGTIRGIARRYDAP